MQTGSISARDLELYFILAFDLDVDFPSYFGISSSSAASVQHPKGTLASSRLLDTRARPHASG